MKISGAEALALLAKWQNEAAELKGLLESVPQFSSLLKFRGVVLSISNGGVTVGDKGKFELFLDLDGADVEYEDSREAPEHLREWSATNFAGLLVITHSFWRCSFFEGKD